ncbi:MAG TPA: hypothetical protein VGY57_14365, partial [Vicinamibacterales bacterium]|nr:hypothetical protein [Vicinamibacterales bacterium]
MSVGRAVACRRRVITACHAASTSTASRRGADAAQTVSTESSTAWCAGSAANHRRTRSVSAGVALPA